MQLDDRQRALDVCMPTDGKLFEVPAAEEEDVDNPYRRLEGSVDTSTPDGWDMERWKEGGTLAEGWEETVDERRWKAFIVSRRVDLLWNQGHSFSSTAQTNDVAIALDTNAS